MRATDDVVTTYIVITTHSLRSKSRMCCYFYSLFVQSIHTMVNKATFMVAEIIRPTSRNIKSSIINATSLSDSINYLVKWQRTPLFSFPKRYSI